MGGSIYKKRSTKKLQRRLKIGIKRQNINVTYQLQSTMIFGNNLKSKTLLDRMIPRLIEFFVLKIFD